MQNKTSTIPALIVMIGALLYSGCATSPLTQVEKSKIKSISVLSNIGNELSYTTIGTTVFQNHEDTVPAAELVSELVTQIEKTISARGYTVLKSNESSDCILVIECFHSEKLPDGQFCKSVGFSVHTIFGLNPGVD